MVRRFLGNLIKKHYWKKEIILMPLSQKKHFEEYKTTISRLYPKLAPKGFDLFLLFSLVKKTAKLKGTIAELGVFEGKSARIICEAKEQQRKLILFDTWEGLPEDGKYEWVLKKGELNASLSKVKERLKGYSNVEYKKGLIQDTLKKYKNNKFAFVYLDLDLYNSTKYALEFLYPRMVKGGIILTHDYDNFKDVQIAFDEFFRDKTEIIYDVSETQAHIQKN